MHEFHAWIELSESAQESDLGQLEEKVAELYELVADSDWHDAVFEIRNLNGGHFFTATGLINRRRSEGHRLDLFLALIARRLPGSRGLVSRPVQVPGPEPAAGRVLPVSAELEIGHLGFQGFLRAEGFADGAS